MTTSTVQRRTHHSLLSELEEALAAQDLLSVLDRSAELARRASQSDDSGDVLRDLTRLAAQGSVASLVAMETAAELRGAGVDDFVVDNLAHPVPLVRRHAAWRLGSRPASPAAYTPLTGQLVSGGIDTLHAHRTLRRWSRTDPDGIFQFASRVLELTEDGPARARLVDLLGSIDHPGQAPLLARIAGGDDHDAARIAAVGALGELRSEVAATALARLALDDGRVGVHAALALDGLTGGDRESRRPQSDGSRIAQLVLAGDLDGQLSLGGRGDTGGVASLLVSLGEALARRDDVDHVLTIGRGTPLSPWTPIGPVMTRAGCGSTSPPSNVACGDSCDPLLRSM